MDARLVADLAELTKRPLVIRTDGQAIPIGNQEMLPRTEDLRSCADAVEWLRTQFSSEINTNHLSNAKLCLIAHHFIPSVAAAWARAEPKNRIVRIESLWGIPEGLYWSSHDTFEIDTRAVHLGTPRPLHSKYKVWKRLRYKGRFIASDLNGKWVAHVTKPPHDWVKSIKRQDWLFEIANTTRQIAEREKYPVSVMWFIDNHPQAKVDRILPWYHQNPILRPSRSRR